MNQDDITGYANKQIELILNSYFDRLIEIEKNKKQTLINDIQEAKNNFLCELKDFLSQNNPIQDFENKIDFKFLYTQINSLSYNVEVLVKQFVKSGLYHKLKEDKKVFNDLLDQFESGILQVYDEINKLELHLFVFKNNLVKTDEFFEPSFNLVQYLNNKVNFEETPIIINFLKNLKSKIEENVVKIYDSHVEEINSIQAETAERKKKFDSKKTDLFKEKPIDTVQKDNIKNEIDQMIKNAFEIYSNQCTKLQHQNNINLNNLFIDRKKIFSSKIRKCNNRLASQYIDHMQKYHKRRWQKLMYLFNDFITTLNSSIEDNSKLSDEKYLRKKFLENTETCLKNIEKVFNETIEQYLEETALKLKQIDDKFLIKLQEQYKKNNKLVLEKMENFLQIVRKAYYKN